LLWDYPFSDTNKNNILKKFIKIILVIIAVALVGGFIWWQQHKKRIIKDSIENAISKGTGNVYFIHYDSSAIDELNGNASFYNVALQSDSLQQQLNLYDTASEATIYNVLIDEVTVRGADIPSLLSNTAVDAKNIEIIHPVIYIISSGKKEKQSYNRYDTLAIYEKLLGKFNSIHASEINIRNGFLNFADKTGKPHTALNDINIQVKNFKIDSTKDYQNIISYFIKDVVASVKTINIKETGNQTSFTDVEYNAPAKFLKLRNFQQKNEQGEVVFDVNNTAINNFATDSFILKQQLRAEELISDGGSLTFYRKPVKTTSTTDDNDEISIDNNYFDEALLNKINIGNTKIAIYNKAKPKESPFILTNVKFSASDIQKVYSGTSIKNLIGKSNWLLSADGFSFLSEDKRYKMSVGKFNINSAASTMSLGNFSVTPQISEANFAKTIKYQEDLFNLNFNHIEMTGLNARLLVTDRRIEAETVSMQPEIKIFNDRLVEPNPASKVGKYPHQLLQKVKLPVNIKKLVIKNGYVAYKERAIVSKQSGTIFFKNINAVITNVTNAKDAISKNNIMALDASAMFMGVGNLQTNWKLPLNTTDGSFTMSGTIGSFNAEALSSITEPLGMVSIRKGTINKLTFEMTGNDLRAKGTSTLLYEDLKVDVLKKDSTDTKKKDVESFLANLLIKDKNPMNGETRVNEINNEREITKSFFNLVWKSIFAAAKKTAQGKSSGK
jgi:hypothetical protein